MDITINARHCTVPDSLKNQAELRLSRLQRFDRRLTGGTVVFAMDHGIRLVDTRLAVIGAPPLVGQGQGPTLRAALDLAIERLERQLKRRRQRILHRRSRAARRMVAP